MDRQGWQFMIGAVGFAAAVHVVSWLVKSCGQDFVMTALSGRQAATCGEFWFNRYQSLLAGLIALAGAWLTIQTMRHQTAVSRADEADRRLSRYIAALKNLGSALDGVSEPFHPAEIDHAALAEFETAAKEPSLAEAMADGCLGRDVSMLAFLIRTCSKCATGKAYMRDVTAEQMVIEPLSFALLDSINKRQDMLRRGTPIAQLYDLRLIDSKEVYSSIQEQRSPILE